MATRSSSVASWDLTRARAALAGAVVCGLALAATAIIARGSSVARLHDAQALHGFTQLLVGTPIWRVADFLTRVANPVVYALTIAGLIAAAVRQGRGEIAIFVGVVMVGAAATSELLKPLLDNPRDSYVLDGAAVSGSSWPSGTSTAAMAIAICAIVVVRPRLRPHVAGLAGLLALGCSYSVLMLGWHFPSDVLGGLLVSGLWGALGVAGLCAADRHPAQGASGWRPIAMVIVGLAAGVVMLLALTVAVLSSGVPTGHGWFAVGAFAIAATVSILSTAPALALSLAAPARSPRMP